MLSYHSRVSSRSSMIWVTSPRSCKRMVQHKNTMLARTPGQTSAWSTGRDRTRGETKLLMLLDNAELSVANDISWHAEVPEFCAFVMYAEPCLNLFLHRYNLERAYLLR